MNAALARRAGKLLEEAKARRLTLATAESCTAGTLALLLADVPAAAACFHGGFVAYTKENKTASLGVPAALIDAHTAVSSWRARRSPTTFFALDRARGPPRRGCADPARGETPTPQDRDAGTRARGGPRRRERPPAGAQVLAPWPCLSELRGCLRQARGRLTSPALDPCTVCSNRTCENVCAT
jgi:competence-damaged protein